MHEINVLSITFILHILRSPEKKSYITGDFLNKLMQLKLKIQRLE